MKEAVSIHLLQELEIEEAVELVRSSFNKLHLETSIYRSQGIGGFILSELSNKYSPYKYFVAKIDGAVVGFTEFKMFKDSNTAFLNMVATSSNHKGKGIASKLLNYAISFFKDLQFDNLQLDVFESNVIAKNWYEGIGFSLESKSFFYKYVGEENNTFDDRILVNNFGQFQCLYNGFGFSFLQVFIDCKHFSIGAIDKNLILKDTVLTSDNINSLRLYLKRFNLYNVFYIGKEIVNKDYRETDMINRMKLVL